MQCILYGILNDEKSKKWIDIMRRVYDPEGIAPTIHTAGGGNMEPKIAEIKPKPLVGGVLHR